MRWPTSSANDISNLKRLTKKEMKMVQIMPTSAQKVVHLYPSLLVTGPAAKTPTKAPHCPAWKRALCHLVSMTNSPLSMTPNRCLNAGNATKLPTRNMSKDSMTCNVSMLRASQTRSVHTIVKAIKNAHIQAIGWVLKASHNPI